MSRRLVADDDTLAELQVAAPESVMPRVGRADDRVRAVADAAQVAPADDRVERAPRDAEPGQLRAPDHAVLPGRDRTDSVQEVSSFHIAMWVRPSAMGKTTDAAAAFVGGFSRWS